MPGKKTHEIKINIKLFGTKAANGSPQLLMNSLIIEFKDWTLWFLNMLCKRNHLITLLSMFVKPGRSCTRQFVTAVKRHPLYTHARAHSWTLTPLPLTHTPPVLWTGWVGVHALQSRAKEREIVVNPIQCALCILLTKRGKNNFSPPFSPLGISALSSQCTVQSRHRLAEVHLSAVCSFFFIYYYWVTPPPPPPPPPCSPSTASSFKPTSPLTTSPRFFFSKNTKFYLKHRSSSLQIWTGDLEMKTDFTFFCRTWIGIAYASGERDTPASKSFATFLKLT